MPAVVPTPEVVRDRAEAVPPVLAALRVQRLAPAAVRPRERRHQGRRPASLPFLMTTWCRGPSASVFGKRREVYGATQPKFSP